MGPLRTALAALVSLFLLVQLGGAAAQPSPECARRYRDLLVRLPAVAVLAADQTRANAEVKSLFGLRPEACEPGGYQVYVQGFLRYAQEAVRAKAKQRDGMLRTAMALREVGSLHVPPEERQAAVSLYNQARSDLATTINDVRATPLMEQAHARLRAHGRAPAAAAARHAPGQRPGGAHPERGHAALGGGVAL